MKNLNIYDKTHNVFMYENLEEEINFFYQSILEKLIDILLHVFMV